MARARNIKPGFFTNEDLAELPPLARLLFAGLWTIADRDGKMEDRPKRIKNQTLPYDDCDMENLLDCLAKAGFIVRYEHPSGKFIAIPTWRKHQNPHGKEAASTIPEPVSPSSSHEINSASRALTLNPKPLTDERQENARSEFEAVLDETCNNLQARHPAVRSCGKKEILGKLRAICKRFPAAQRIPTLRRLDSNHASLCKTEQWTKQGGEFAKALSNWLAPTLDRWEDRAPPDPRAVDYSNPKRYELGE